MKDAVEMAKYVIPPKTAIVKCHACKALYVPDRARDSRWRADRSFASFEKCPVCGYDDNNFKHTIPLWRYNLIKLFRGGFRNGEEENEDDEQETDPALQ